MPPNYVKIKGFTFEPKATEIAIAAALAWFDAKKTLSNVTRSPSTNMYFTSLGNFAAFKADGTMPNWYGDSPFEFFNQACHNYLSCVDNRAKDIDVVSFWTDTEAHNEHHRFFDWFNTKSFASQFILGIHKRGIVVSADIPANLMHCIGMMSRVARMFPKEHFTRFNSLLDNGIPGEVAYLTCFCVGKGPAEYAFSPSSDHRPFCCPNLEGMKRFLTGEFWKVNPELYRDTRNMYCSHFLGGVGIDRGKRLTDDISSDRELVDLIMASRKEKNSGVYKPPNPFISQKPGVLVPGQYSYKEVYEIALPYFNKKGHFNVEA